MSRHTSIQKYCLASDGEPAWKGMTAVEVAKVDVESLDVGSGIRENSEERSGNHQQSPDRILARPLLTPGPC